MSIKLADSFYKQKLYLKPFFKSINFKPNQSEIYKDIHQWKFQVMKGKIGQTNALLKITENFHRDGYFKILNEIATDNLIKRFEHKSKKRAPYYRKVLHAGSNEHFTWIAKEFVGDPFGISWYVMNPKFINNQVSLINKTFDEIDRLHEIPYPEVQHFIPQRLPFINVDTINRRLNRLFKNNSFKKALSFFFENQHIIEKERAFIHGDFRISNIIITPQRTYLTDFEDATVDHPFSDIARLWLTSALNNKIRKAIVKKYIKNKSDEKMFHILLARDLLGLLLILSRLPSTTENPRLLYEKSFALEEFPMIGKGLSEHIKLADAQAKKYKTMEKDLTNIQYYY